jgi:hypothetical protein
MPTKWTLKQAGYTHHRTLSSGQHVLKDTETGRLELWFCNRNHASFGLIYKNTHLEFAGDYKEETTQ